MHAVFTQKIIAVKYATFAVAKIKPFYISSPAMMQWKSSVSTLTWFLFLISDSTPPTFGATCPRGPLLAYAERDKFSALVNWTEPVAIDNSGITPTVTSNYQSPRRFSQGSHVITYTAVDQAGNKAACSFTVIVIGNKIFNVNNCFPVLVSIFWVELLLQLPW